MTTNQNTSSSSLVTWTFFWNGGATDSVEASNAAGFEELSTLLADVSGYKVKETSGAWRQGKASTGYWDAEYAKWGFEALIDSQVFAGGSKLVLQFASGTYYQLGALDYIELFFAEKSDDGFIVCQPQYFHRDDIALARRAYTERRDRSTADQAQGVSSSLEEISQRVRNRLINHHAVKVEEMTPVPKNDHELKRGGEIKMGGWEINMHFGDQKNVFYFVNPETGRVFRLDFTEASKDLN